MTLAVDGGEPLITKPFPAWPEFGREEEQLLLEVLHSGQWGGTARNKLKEFEERFARLQDAKHAVSAVNGTVAISVALLAAGVGPGDEVIMPPYTFIATATAALLIGAVPVFADVEKDTLLLDPSGIEERITPRTKAIIAVHLAGAIADMTGINAIARRHGLAVIEDAAQAAGAKWEGKGAGALGDLGTFSYQSSKNMTAGEGGMILSDDEALSDMAWSLCNVGRVRGGGWYQHEHIGWNLRMTEFQAAVLLPQLDRLQVQMAKRSANARLLGDILNGIEGVHPVAYDPRITSHAYHLYLFHIDSAAAIRAGKEEIMRRLSAEGVPVLYGYHPLNRNPAIIRETAKRLGKDAEPHPCPVAETASGQTVLWLYQNVLLAEEDTMHLIGAAIQKVIHSFDSEGAGR
jgi:dTDP-4-amino-4,6-dideoxygalactose transaminase